LSIRNNVKASVLYQIVISGLQFSIIWALTRILGASGRADLAVFNSAIDVATIFGGLGLGSALVYFVASKKITVQQGWSAIAYLLFWMTLAIIALSFIFQQMGWQHRLTPFKINNFSLFLFIIIVVANIAFQLISSLLNAANEFQVPLLVRTIQLLIFIGLIVTIHLQWISIKDVSILTYISLMVFLFVAMVITLSFYAFYKLNLGTVKIFRSPVFLKVLLQFSLMAFACNTIQMLNYRLDIWFLQTYTAKEEIGIYSIATLCVQMLWLLPYQISNVYYTKFSAIKDQSNLPKLVAKLNSLLFYGAVIAFLIAFAASIFFIPFFFGIAFKKSALLLGLLLTGAICIAASMALSIFNASQDNLKVNLYSSIIGFFLCLILYPLMIKQWGVQGAAIASSISYTVTYLYLCFHFCKTEQIKCSEMFSLRPLLELKRNKILSM
jgi:O-antigen/teichoic acid export membrane protein